MTRCEKVVMIARLATSGEIRISTARSVFGEGCKNGGCRSFRVLRQPCSNGLYCYHQQLFWLNTSVVFPGLLNRKISAGALTGSSAVQAPRQGVVIADSVVQSQASSNTTLPQQQPRHPPPSRRPNSTGSTAGQLTSSTDLPYAVDDPLAIETPTETATPFFAQSP